MDGNVHGFAGGQVSSDLSSNPGALPRISVIAPAYNERDNIRPLTLAIGEALRGIAWELIVVDDDSPDGTADAAIGLAREGFPVRCIRRVGRRGLASAVVEGALSASADVIAVIDSDMQHDERILPLMLEAIETGDADVVIGSRHVADGSVGDWSARRQKMSSFATWCARFALGTTVSDPMSGFFAIRRDAFHACIYDLSQQGYKILLDILSSSPRPLKVVELPYVFRNRVAGESKVDVMILAEFLFLLIEKATKGVVPPKFVIFCLVGAFGLAVHMATLEFLQLNNFTFLHAQAGATWVAMTVNYAVNNSFTYRAQRLRGLSFYTGYVIFCLVCTIGAIANVGVADLVLSGSGSWPLAGIAGALMSVVFNFGAASQLVWRSKRRRRRPVVLNAPA